MNTPDTTDILERLKETVGVGDSCRYMTSTFILNDAINEITCLRDEERKWITFSIEVRQEIWSKNAQIESLRSEMATLKEANKNANAMIGNISDELGAIIKQKDEELEKEREKVKQLDDLRLFLREQSVLADKSSHEWDSDWTGRNPQACYRSGMWWTFEYADGPVENRMAWCPYCRGKLKEEREVEA